MILIANKDNFPSKNLLKSAIFLYNQSKDAETNSFSRKKHDRKSMEGQLKNVHNPSSFCPFHNHCLRKTSKEIIKVKKLLTQEKKTTKDAGKKNKPVKIKYDQATIFYGN